MRARVAALIGSGPSLTERDCALVRAGVDYVLAVNCSWQIAEADAVYAADRSWWDWYYAGLPKHLAKWTCDEGAAAHYKLNLHRTGSRSGSNSGSLALRLLLSQGFDRILMMGFDCSVQAGRHWHADHQCGEPAYNPTARQCDKWRLEFGAIDIGDTQVINASRETALTCFNRMDLEDALVL